MREIDLNKYGFAIRKLLKPTKAAVLRCYVAGYRGDWKALSQVFAFERFYNKNEATVLGERVPQTTIHIYIYTLYIYTYIHTYTHIYI